MPGAMVRTMGIAVVGLGLGCGPGTSLDDDDGSGSASGSGTASETEGGSSGSGSSSGSSTSAADGSTSAGSSDGAEPCTAPPVDEEVLGQLFIRGGSQGYVAAGDAEDLILAWIDFGYPTEVEACVEWSVAPVDGVSIDAAGVLTIAPEVPAGTIVSITADVEAGRRILTTELEVYEPLESPILGFWSEVMQLPCDGGPAFVPEPILPELVFYDTGEFTVTWTPFEVYIDYWGTYVYDEGTGELSLTVEGGNYVPADVDAEGTATVVDGALTLEDMWLGTAQSPVTPAACGHVFE